MSSSHAPKQPSHSRSTSVPKLFQSLFRHGRNISISSTASVFSTRSVSTAKTTPPSSRGGSRPTSEQYPPGTVVPPLETIKPPTSPLRPGINVNDVPEEPKAAMQPMKEVQGQGSSLPLSDQSSTLPSPASLGLTQPTSEATGTSNAPEVEADAQPQQQPKPQARRSTNPFRSAAPLPPPPSQQQHHRTPSNPFRPSPPPAAIPAATTTPAQPPPPSASTTTDLDSVYVLTLATSPDLSAKMQALRSTHILAHGDVHAGAHVTLFRALAPAHLQRVEEALQRACARRAPLRASTGEVLRLPKGVAVALERGVERRVVVLREELRAEWEQALEEVDRGPFRGAWVVVDGVENGYIVERTMQELERWEGAKGFVHGLVLWRVAVDGAWSFHRSYEFLGKEKWPVDEKKQSGS